MKQQIKKMFIHTYGCQMNVHDSEKISGILQMAGYEKAFSIQEADIIILNTCSVREKAEHKVHTEIGRIGKIKMKKKDLIVAICGCVAQQEKESLLAKSNIVDIVIGPKN